MNKLIISYSIKPETYAGLKRLAKLADCSASSYLDRLVANDLDRLQLVIEDGDMLHPNQTPPYDGPTFEAV